MVSLIELLADVHGPCLQEMEARLARWESNARHNIGDFLYNTLLNVLPLYDQYLENLIPVLEKMEYYTRTSRRFDQLCRDFEAQKHCYLPLTSFLLKPLQRLLHYNSIIDSTFVLARYTLPYTPSESLPLRLFPAGLVLFLLDNGTSCAGEMYRVRRDVFVPTLPMMSYKHR